MTTSRLLGGSAYVAEVVRLKNAHESIRVSLDRALDPDAGMSQQIALMARAAIALAEATRCAAELETIGKESKQERK